MTVSAIGQTGSVKASGALPMRSCSGTTEISTFAPPLLGHGAVMSDLEDWCKGFNGMVERRIEDFGDVHNTAESMDDYVAWRAGVSASLLSEGHWGPFYGFDRGAIPAEPEDLRTVGRYKSYLAQLHDLTKRQIAAARQHNFDQLRHLLGVEDRVRRERENLVAEMGLRYCGKWVPNANSS